MATVPSFGFVVGTSPQPQQSTATKDPPNMPIAGQRVRWADPPATEGVVVSFDVTNGIGVYWDMGFFIVHPASTWMSMILPIQACSTASSPSPTTLAAPQEQRLCRRKACGKPADDGSPFCSDSCFIRENW